MKPALEVEVSGAAEDVDEAEAEAPAGAITGKEVAVEWAVELDMEVDMVVVRLLLEDPPMEEEVMVVAEVAARAGGKHPYRRPLLRFLFSFPPFSTPTQKQSPQNSSKQKKNGTSP
jgi:hypothetical protein